MGERLSAIDAEVLQEQGARGGNRLLVFDIGGEARLLKCYRGRRGWFRDAFRNLGHWFEGKRATTPTARYRTERTSLRLWAEHRFDVPAVFDDPLPEGIEAPALWMAYCPGPTLRDVLRERALPDAVIRDLLRQYGVGLGARQAAALAKQEPLLVHEHASVFHVLVHAGRLVTFDLEGGYRKGANLEGALEQELGGFARSILRARPQDAALYVDALMEGYVGGNPARFAQAHEIAERGIAGRGLLRRVRRMRAAWRRRFKGKPSKADGCRLVLDALAKHQLAGG